MERVQRIVNHPQYQKWLAANEQAEKGRRFCHHNMEHNLAAARIAYILWLEQGGDLAMKPLFYAAALLHDIGKWQKALFPQKGHEALSAALAEELLPQCGFDGAEQAVILNGILAHSGTDRRQETAAKKEKTFAEIFYLADKLSRPCWECEAKEDCYWSVKNERLEY